MQDNNPISQESDYYNSPDSIDNELDEALESEEELLKKKFEPKDDYPFMSKQVAQQKGIRFRNKDKRSASSESQTHSSTETVEASDEIDF